MVINDVWLTQCGLYSNKVTNYFYFCWNSSIPTENFRGMLQKTLKSLAKPNKTKKAIFITFPIPSTFCAYSLQVGYAEQLLPMNQDNHLYFSSRGDTKLQVSALSPSAAHTPSILMLGKQQLSLPFLTILHFTLRVSLFRQINYGKESFSMESIQNYNNNTFIDSNIHITAPTWHSPIENYNQY